MTIIHSAALQCLPLNHALSGWCATVRRYIRAGRWIPAVCIGPRCADICTGIRERRRVRARTRIVLGAKGRQNARTGPCVHSAAGWFLREIGPLHPWVLMLRTLACAERCSSTPFGKRRIFSKIFSISNSIKQGLTHTGKRIRGEEIQNCEKL